MGDEIARLREEVDALRARLAVADQQTCDFVSRLAHELRTPLGAILMWGHVLRTGRDSDREAAVSAIESSARSQSKMIGALLDVCRGVAGRLKIESVPVDLAASARDAVAALAGTAEMRKVKLRSTIGREPVRVSGDAARLTEIVSILVDNALKFTAPEGTVDVSLTVEGATARVEVRDTGRGLSRDDLARIFVPFRSGGAGNKGVSGGLGVGLALARQLAELHGGTLTVASPGAGTGTGAGSTFTFAVPLVAS